MVEPLLLCRLGLARLLNTRYSGWRKTRNDEKKNEKDKNACEAKCWNACELRLARAHATWERWVERLKDCLQRVYSMWTAQYMYLQLCIYVYPTSCRKRMKKRTKIEEFVQGQCFHWCSHPTRYWKFARLKRTGMGWLEFFDLNLKFCASIHPVLNRFWSPLMPFQSLFLGGAIAAIPIFNRMLNGTDCDQNWSWHVAWPGKVIWRDATKCIPSCNMD